MLRFCAERQHQIPISNKTAADSFARAGDLLRSLCRQLRRMGSSRADSAANFYPARRDRYLRCLFKPYYQGPTHRCAGLECARWIVHDWQDVSNYVPSLVARAG